MRQLMNLLVVLSVLGVPALTSASASFPTSGPGGCIPPTVEFRGKLSSELVEVDDPIDRTNLPPELAQLDLHWLRKVWKLTSNGKTYNLDFGGGKDLQHRAEQLDGRNVVVSAVPQSGTGSLLVVDLESDGQVAVVVQGKLQIDQTDILRPFDVSWYVTAGKQHYYLDFGGNKELEKLATTDGTVSVSGQLEVIGRWLVVHVQSLKPAVNVAASGQVAVEIEGLLDGCFMELEPLTCYPPRDDCKVLIPKWLTVTAGGQTYNLDLSGYAGLLTRASRLLGKRVTVRGTLEGNRVVVTGLEAAGVVLEEHVYEGSSDGCWLKEDGVYSLKSHDHRPMVDQVRDILGDDLKVGGHSVRIEGKNLVVRTTAANHKRIKEFLDLVATIPGPPSQRGTR